MLLRSLLRSLPSGLLVLLSRFVAQAFAFKVHNPVSCCRILEIWQYYLYFFCPVSIPFQAKMAVSLLIQYSLKTCGSPLYVMGSDTITKKGPPQIFLKLFHLYSPQIFLGLHHLYSWLLLRWLSGFMSHIPNFFKKYSSSITFGLSRECFLNSDFNFSIFYNLDRLKIFQIVKCLFLFV